MPRSGKYNKNNLILQLEKKPAFKSEHFKVSTIIERPIYEN